MSSRILFRLIGVPLAAIALGLLLGAAPARAGGGEIPTGPSFGLSAPTIAVDRDGIAYVSVDLRCFDEAAAEAAHVSISVVLQQRQAGGGAWLEATCIDGTQTLTLVVRSVTERGFRPGPIGGLIEYEGQTSKGYGHAAAPLDQLALRVRPAR